MTEKEKENLGNGDLRGKPDKKITQLNVPVPATREEQAGQQSRGASPQDQK